MALSVSSSRGISPSALHSYSKRRFIRPFAPPCFLFTFSPVVVRWWEPGGQWEGESRGSQEKVRRKSFGLGGGLKGCWQKFFLNSIVQALVVVVVVVVFIVVVFLLSPLAPFGFLLTLVR